MIPARRKKPRRTDDRSVPSHLKWVRGHYCLVHNAECSDRIEAAHVRKGTDGGTSLKPHDMWTVPLCDRHHAEQHAIGEDSFATKYRLDLKDTALKLWALSPAGRKYRRETMDA